METFELCKRRLEREMGARRVAEEILEKKSFELYEANSRLERKKRELSHNSLILEEAQKISRIGNCERDLIADELNWSKEMFEIMGQDPKRFKPTDQSFLHLICSEERENFVAQVRHTIETHEPLDTCFKAIKPDKSEIIVHAIGKVILDNKNRPIAFIGTYQDVTEIKMTQQKLLESEKITAMEEMLNIIAHQWRQPLAVISMGINNITLDMEFGDIDNNKLRNTLQKINEKTQELSKTISDFSTFFAPEKKEELFAPSEMIEKLLGLIEATMKNHKIEIQKEYNSSAKIVTFKKELGQAVMNLIKNAKDVLLERKIKKPVIQIKTYDDNKNYCIQICDNGGGISDAVKSNLFKPYFSTKYEQNYKGLGLYTSKTMVEKSLNGRISFENREDGACFCIIIPIKHF